MGQLSVPRGGTSTHPSRQPYISSVRFAAVEWGLLSRADVPALTDAGLRVQAFPAQTSEAERRHYMQVELSDALVAQRAGRRIWLVGHRRGLPVARIIVSPAAPETLIVSLAVLGPTDHRVVAAAGQLVWALGRVLKRSLIIGSPPGPADGAWRQALWPTVTARTLHVSLVANGPGVTMGGYLLDRPPAAGTPLTARQVRRLRRLVSTFDFPAPLPRRSAPKLPSPIGHFARHDDPARIRQVVAEYVTALARRDPSAACAQLSAQGRENLTYYVRAPSVANPNPPQISCERAVEELTTPIIRAAQSAAPHVANAHIVPRGSDHARVDLRPMPTLELRRYADGWLIDNPGLAVPL